MWLFNLFKRKPKPEPNTVYEDIDVGSITINIIEDADKYRALAKTFVGRVYHDIKFIGWTAYTTPCVKSAFSLVLDWMNDRSQFRSVDDDKSTFLNVDKIKEIKVGKTEKHIITCKINERDIRFAPKSRAN